MEELLHYVWKQKLYPLRPLLTTDGRSVEVVNAGVPNPNAGPDFFNAEVRIGGVRWVGNVELHPLSSQWFAHHHDTDPRYDSVILHVVTKADVPVFRKNGQPIPQLELPVPEGLAESYRELCSTDSYPPCCKVIPQLPATAVADFFSALLEERMEQRSLQITARYKEHELNWNDALFSTLARNFGFGVNGDAFDWWARSIPFRAVDHHRDNLFQIEAIFLGQAGLLSPEALPDYCRASAATDLYFQRLCKEYAFLAHKFSLTPMDPAQWRFLRLRPAGFPHVRLSQLAGMYYQQRFDLSVLLEAPGLHVLRALLQTEASPYWNTHYVFGGTPTEALPKRLSDSSLNLLVINSVAPMLYVYGRHQQNPRYVDRAYALLKELKAENNYIIRTWETSGLKVQNAAESQALMQLKREYCEKQECLRCRIGQVYLQQSNKRGSGEGADGVKEGGNR